MTDRRHNPAEPATFRPSSFQPATLFSGVEGAACKALAIRSLRHRSALHELTGRSKIKAGVVETVHAAMASNFRIARARGTGRTSSENWRWCKPQPQIADHNFSPEVKLERAIAAACVRAGRRDWANQVPVASGVMGSHADRRRAIDLVHQVSDRHFELIELKIASDTPLYAAIEIIGYGCAWLLAREERGVDGSPLLGADRIDLIVVAPRGYYAPYSLNRLQVRLDAELSALGNQNGVRLGFRFECLPQELVETNLPSDEQLLALLDQRPSL